MPGFESSGLRRRPFRDYLIFYVVRGDQISIALVTHAAKDYAADLAPFADD